MIQTVFTAALPIGESLVVRKNRIVGSRAGGPRVAVVTGMHGDELEGQFVAFELARRLNERPGELKGTVDIYPALNPLGLSAHEHGVPHVDIDLDNTFPGNPNGNLTEALAHAVFNDILGARVCVVVHSSNAYVNEITQVRIDEADSASLVRLASQLNARLVWVRAPRDVLGSTLAHTLNSQGTPTLVVEMGSGMSLNQSMGEWLVEGILRLLDELGAWAGPTVVLPHPLVSGGGNVVTVAAAKPGLFLPREERTVGAGVRRGDLLGLVVDPLEGVVRSEIKAPCNGMLFSLRTYPVVYPGSLLARVLEEQQ